MNRLWSAVVVVSSFFMGYALISVVGATDATAQIAPPVPSSMPAESCPPRCPIPGTTMLAPQQGVTFYRPAGPNERYPQSISVTNRSDHIATVSYETPRLTITVPEGLAVVVLEFSEALSPGASPTACKPVAGQAHIVECPAAGLVGASVSFTTMVATEQTEPVALFPGCNNVALTWPNGTPIVTVVRALDRPDEFVASWRYDAATRRFLGWSPLPNAPNDLTTVDRLDVAFVCVREAGTLRRPAPSAN